MFSQSINLVHMRTALGKETRIGPKIKDVVRKQLFKPLTEGEHGVEKKLLCAVIQFRRDHPEVSQQIDVSFLVGMNQGHGELPVAVHEFFIQIFYTTEIHESDGPVPCDDEVPWIGICVDAIEFVKSGEKNLVQGGGHGIAVSLGRFCINPRIQGQPVQIRFGQDVLRGVILEYLGDHHIRDVQVFFKKFQVPSFFLVVDFLQVSCLDFVQGRSIQMTFR